MFDLLDHLQLSTSSHIALSFSQIHDPTFLFPSCICSELSSFSSSSSPNRKVLLISTHHSLDHYHHICKKMKGLSLHHHPHFIWLDAITYFHASHPSLLPEPTNSNVHWLNYKEDPLDTLFSVIQSHVPCLVLLDDVMPFIYSGLSVQHVLSFIRKLTWLMESSHSTLISITHRDLHLPESKLLSLAIPNLAEKIVLWNGLSTGYAKDVDGEMMFIHGKQSSVHSSSSSLQSPSDLIQVHYKLQESGIRFFGKGLSMQVM